MRILFLGGLGVAALCYQIVSLSSQLQVTKNDAEKILVAKTANGIMLSAVGPVMVAPELVLDARSWPTALFLLGNDYGNGKALAIPSPPNVREDDSNATGYWRQ